jgi:DhnA family fructose-bisphosphate aldolase class Ia
MRPLKGSGNLFYLTTRYETLSYPTEYDQTLYASVEQAFNMGAVAVGATIYFG